MDPNSPIIDPSLFYLLNVLAGLKDALGWIGGFGLFVGIVLAIIMMCWRYMSDDRGHNFYDENLESDVRAMKTLVKYTRIFVIGSLICLFVMVFVPNKETMLQIIAAKLVTPANIESAIGTGKDLVTFLTDTIKNAVQDIIQTSKGVNVNAIATEIPK